MTASGTYSSGFQIDDILTESWERLGKNPAAMTGDVVASALRSLNLMLTDWTNRGVPLWQVETETATLVVGEASYSFPSYVADVLNVTVTISGSDRIMGRISRDVYAAYPNKVLSAPPSQFWINRQSPGITLVLYPTPDQAYPLTLYSLRQTQAATNVFQTVDAPYLWGEALASGLTAKLAEKFEPQRFAEKVALADKAWAAAHDENRERVPLSITPSWN